MIMSVIVMLKTLKNNYIEIKEMRMGLGEYLEDFWNFVEVITIMCTYIYGLTDLSLVIKNSGME